MSMSRRDYEGVAKTLSDMHQCALTTREHLLLCKLTVQLGAQFKVDNSAFDVLRFLEATDYYKFRYT